MCKWEYKIEQMSSSSLDRLNELGKEGWQLVAVVQTIYYFKRPIL